MFETRKILTDMQQALAANTEFVNWCVAEFGRPPTIQIEVADLQSLDAADFPFIGLFDVNQDSGMAAPRMEWSVKLLAGVSESELTAEVVNSCTLRAYTGRLQVEDLREQAVVALYRAALGARITTDGASVPNQYHPRYYSGTQLQITKQNNSQ